MDLGEATVEGRYTLKIRDKETGEIKDEFSFSNFITDQGLYQRGNNHNIIISCGIATELPNISITEPTVGLGNSLNTNGKFNILTRNASTDIYPGNTPCVLSDATKSKRVTNRIETDVIDRVERRIFNFAASFIFRDGNEGSYKSLFINCNYPNNAGGIFITPYSPSHIFSYAIIKRNGAPYTLVLGPNDVLEVYYQFILYDDNTPHPKTITRNINNVNTTVTIDKLQRTTMYGGVDDLWGGQLILKGATPSNPNATTLLLSNTRIPVSNSGTKITGGLKSTYRYTWVDGDIASGSKIHSLEVDHGINRYVLTFNPPILKSDYQEWSMSLSYQLKRKVSA